MYRKTLIILSVLLFSVQIMFAQSTKKIDISLRNATLKEFLSAIEKQTDYTFMYNKIDIKNEKHININVKQLSVDEILKQVLPPKKIRFEVVGSQIILKENKDNDTDIQGVTGNIKITGNITDEKGEPIIGASVVIKGTTNGTITDVDGNFSLLAKANDILSISYLGYLQKTIAIKNNTKFDIELQEDTKILDEVVVVGYGTQKKANITGAVAYVSAEALESRPITNLSQGLQGLIGNLNISPDSGAPGKGAGFNIRGTTSINNDSGPLVLVDGVQMDPNLINPADVESVSVLKDAASASIYGTKAAYGVVLITTKKGKEGKAKVSFSSNFAVNTPTRIPEYMDSWTFANFLNETHRNSGGGNYFDEFYMSKIYAHYTDPKHNLPVFIDPANPNKYMYAGNTDWRKETLKENTMQQQHTLSVSGKAARTDYYASVGFFNQNGMLKHYDDSYKRFNVNLDLTAEIQKWIQLRFKTVYNNTYRDAPFGNNDWNEFAGFYGADLRPLMPVYHPDGNWSGQGSWTNMAALQALSGTRKHKENDLWLTGGIILNPIKDLNVNVEYTFNMYDKTKRAHGKEIIEHTANPNITSVYPHTKPSSIEFTNDDNYYHVVRAFADYSKSFAKHNFKIMAGYDYEYKHINWFSAKRQGLINNDLGHLGQAVGEKYNGSGESEWATMGYFARLNYNFDDRYLLEVNARYDGSSKFPSSDRFNFYPSFSAAWRISNEKFFEGAKSIVDDLKFRGSYGSLGNQSVGGNYPYIPTMGTSVDKGYLIDGKRIAAVTPAGLVSSQLTWETVTQIDLGVDWILLNNRLFGSFDWYRRNTKDMVTSGRPLPAVLGHGAPQENTADLKTLGWEVSVGWRHSTSKDFSYDVTFIMSDYKAEITKFDNPQKILSTHYVGKKWGEIWGFETEGLFQSQSEIDNHADQSKMHGGAWYPGDVKYKDLNGDGEISVGNNTLTDPGDQKIIGNREPRYSYGIKTGARWKNFDIDIFFQGIGKKDFVAGGNQFWGFGNEWHIPYQHSLDSWREDNTGAYFPRSSYEDRNGNRETQTRYLQDASYIRLKSASIGYTLPKPMLKKVGIDNIRVYLSGQNLFTITDLLDIYDPESTNVGNYPLNRSLSVGFNITL